ncbi:Imm10 family immunity protein [Diaphorobacter aerolatus]|uniref:Uncharacterized protein n=1 Tax=Diaphorobacter aerolatus TaxID=1288495 RepID=A0A7H0GMH2_9BURK|nr:Imm10 family immunity protein [Diaphorobacter aerolatus]QNP49488.1 hypothetical protein H9K75_05635 [Diaphorobacter aerolatus]
MKFEFSANEVNYSFENGIHTLGLADDKNEPKDYIILQRSIEIEEKDRELGQDTYYIEICADGVAGYGGIKSVLLSANTLKIEIGENAIWRGDLLLIEINIQVAKNFKGLRDGLSAIFLGTNTMLMFD